MTVTEITAKSLLRRYKRIDSWFISSMGMNLYRGCSHGCAYCDGRAEQYRLQGMFGRDIEVKINAAALLKKELSPSRRPKPLPNGFVIIGGGVTDAWQNIDRKYTLTSQVLDILLEARLPVHALTKSARIVDSIDRLTAIHAARRALVSFSFSSVNEAICTWVEPGLPGPKHRLDAMSKAKTAGLGVGMFLMPVIPGLTDTEQEMTRSLKAAKEAGADFVVFGGMTLKPGRQYDHFIALIRDRHPDLLPGYEKIYPGNRWGSALPAYYQKIGRRLAPIARDLRLPLRIPDTFWGDLVTETEKVALILEHLDYLTRLESSRSFFGVAARSILDTKKGIRDLDTVLPTLRGIGPFTIDIIEEILKSGTSSHYRGLLGA